MRNTELGAVLGLSQIKNLNSNILKRNLNLRLFLKLLNKEKYFVEFDMQEFQIMPCQLFLGCHHLN